MGESRSRGRGANYSRFRGLVEWSFKVLYARGWPGRAWGLLPRAARVRSIDRTFRVRQAHRPALRLGFISDIHLGAATSARTVDRACEILARAELDILLLGGDYVYLDATRGKVEELQRRVENIPAGVKVAVFGNHDLWTDQEILERALEQAGVRVLTNGSMVLESPHDDVALIGLDDPWAGAPEPEAAFEGVNASSTVVALCHSPDGLLYCGDGRVSLFLCGHTHGGQISTPWGPPVVSSGRLTRRYLAGFYRHGSTEVFVSRGVGAVGLPVRMGAPPDVAIVDLLSREE